MTDSGIGWRFPPTGGGVAHGYNDPGIAHFGGAREQSLARETIQNSLDAAAQLGNPVHVEFELHAPGDDWFGKQGLDDTIRLCLAQAQEVGDEKASRAFREADQLLAKPGLTFLRVADRNTTGLRGDKWDALLKRPGASVHDSPGAGGSWGIGKNAPFTLSPLRTVFYWSRFEEEGGPRELFQGKAVLMSHESDGKELQSTGFFGVMDGCLQLSGDAIPAAIRQVDNGSGSRYGTSLWIAGFRGQDGWQERIARRVVASFFGAIADGTLTVTIEPSDGMIAEDLLEITDGTIGRWFAYLEQANAGESGDEEDDIRDARLFWELLQDEPTDDRQFPDLGHCRLWIRVSDDGELPNKVGLMRKTGMLITTKQQGLIQFRGMRDFIAICRFEGDDGNELLRQMENPRHDQFEPDHIENDPQLQRRGRAALRRATSWVREEIRKVAAPPMSAEPTRLSELDRLLPDVEPEEPFGDASEEGGEREPLFGSAPTVSLKPRRRPPRLPLVSDNPDVDDDPDSEDWMNLKGGNGDPPLGPQPEPEPRPSPPVKRVRFPIHDVRLVPVAGDVNRYRVSFTATERGVARVELAEAGDSALVKRSDVRAYALDGTPLSLTKMDLEPQQKMEFEIMADEPIDGRAWLVSAVRLEPSQ